MLSGSSAGSRDFIAAIIAEKGQLLGTGSSSALVSAALTGELFVQPLIAGWLGQPAPMETHPHVEAIMTRKLLSPIGDDEFVRVTVAQVEDRLLAAPLHRGAGMITSLVRADGLAHIRRFSEGVDANQPVQVVLYRDETSVQKTLMIMGSHDPMIDLLAQHVGETRIASANVGSLGD